MKCKGEGIEPSCGPALPYDYTCFVKRFYKVLFWYFDYTILNKTNILYYKKISCIANIFASKKNVFVCVIQPNFSCLMYIHWLIWIHVRGICTSDKYFFKWSTVCKACTNHKVGRAGSITSLFFMLLGLIQSGFSHVLGGFSHVLGDDSKTI